jgi:tetratricopeptide (TPR) repeat protein
MKKIFIFFTFFLFVYLHAQDNRFYSVKIGTYLHLKNAKLVQKKVNTDTYIQKDKKFYGLYVGHFKDKLSAKKLQKQLKEEFKTAYVTSIKREIVNKNIDLKIEKDSFKIAQKYYQLGLYEKALTMFDQVVIDEPNNNLARLEYARTLFKLGFYKDAREEFESVLKTQPPTTVKNNINRYLDKIDSMSKKHFFYGLVGIDLTYDDNLEFNTYIPTTNYGGLELQNDTNRTKGFYTALNFSITHIYLGEYFNWKNSLYSYNEFQNEDVDNLNFISFQTSFSKRYKNIEFSMPLLISGSYLEGRSYSKTISSTPKIEVDSDKRTKISLNLKFQDREFSGDDNRSYQTSGAKVSLIKLYDKLTFYASGAFENDVRKRKVRFDVSRKRFFVITNIYYQLLKNSMVDFGYQYNFDSYSITDQALGYKREDKKEQFIASFKQKLSKTSTATLSYQKLINDSNINAYSYKKNSYTLSCRYNF